MGELFKNDVDASKVKAYDDTVRYSTERYWCGDFGTPDPLACPDHDAGMWGSKDVYVEKPVAFHRWVQSDDCCTIKDIIAWCRVDNGSLARTF